MDYDTYEHLISAAFEIVDTWELPEELIPQAVNDQARLLAGLEPYCSGEEQVPYRFDSRY